MKFSEIEPVEIPLTFVLKPGDVFVFPMEINEESLLPFGIEPRRERLYPFSVDGQF